MDSSTITLTEGMAFDAELGGHHFTIDAKPEHGGQGNGPAPKGLLLTALCGCAGMDVISILRKMRQEPTALSIRSEAELTGEHPKVYGPITVTVTLTGAVEPEKAWKAVGLSRDRYCGVAAMLGKHTAIHYRVVLNGAEVPEPAPAA